MASILPIARRSGWCWLPLPACISLLGSPCCVGRILTWRRRRSSRSEPSDAFLFFSFLFVVVSVLYNLRWLRIGYMYVVCWWLGLVFHVPSCVFMICSRFTRWWIVMFPMLVFSLSTSYEYCLCKRVSNSSHVQNSKPPALKGEDELETIDTWSTRCSRQLHSRK